VYGFIGRGIAAKIEGKDIGLSMITLVNRYKSKSFNVLIDRLNDYSDRESIKLRNKGKESQAVVIQDKVDCIKVIINRVQTLNPKCAFPVEAVVAEIQNIFADSVGGNVVLLSTIHKSKGREWNNVYWLQTGPAKWARQAWELECEKNLKYVAVTRAKENLYMLPLDYIKNTKKEGEK
jgi:superfamily I DNA/RNA helicase